MNQNANATQQQKDFSENEVRFQGYLKSSKLALRQTQQGTDYIGGDVIIALDADHSLAVRCFAYKYSNPQDGSQPSINPGFERLVKFLPTSGDASIVSIGSVIGKNPDFTFEQAMAQATKVYGYGSLEENVFISKTGEEVSHTRIKSGFLDVSTITTGFVPYNRFSLKFYVMAVKEDPDTKRINLGGYYLSYRGMANKIKLITPDPTDTTRISDGQTVGSLAEAAHDYIKAQYLPKTTVSVTGYISDVRIVKAPEVTTSSNPFLAACAPATPISTFVHENIIYGGLEPIANGAEGSISAAAVQAGLTQREAQLGPRTAVTPAAVKPVAQAAPTPAAAPAKPVAQAPTASGFGGFTFAPEQTAAAKQAPVEVPPTSPEVATVVGNFSF